MPEPWAIVRLFTVSAPEVSAITSYIVAPSTVMFCVVPSIVRVSLPLLLIAGRSDVNVMVVSLMLNWMTSVPVPAWQSLPSALVCELALSIAARRVQNEKTYRHHYRHNADEKPD